MSARVGIMGGMLTDRDRRVLALEAAHREHDGRKEDAIRDEFGIKASRYYQLLGMIIDDPDAMKAEPRLVKSLLAARDRRVNARARRGFAA